MYFLNLDFPFKYFLVTLCPINAIGLGFPGGSDGKESACNAGDQGSVPESEDPLEKGMATHSNIHAWTESHGQKSLVGYSPWGCKESDTTEQLTLIGVLTAQ